MRGTSQRIVTAVYSCVRILAETVASLTVHLYRYTETGKERVYNHSLYHMLYDEPNPEMTSFVLRETLTVEARPLASGYVKAKTGDATTAKVYDDWYKAVYLSAMEPETPAPASFAMNQETGKAAEVKSMAKAVADK